MAREYEAMLEMPAQAGGLPDPMVAYSFMLADVETANGPSMGMLELSQEIPFRGKRRLRAGVSRLQAGAAEQAWHAARLDVIVRVRSAYADLYRVDRSLELVRAEAVVLDRLEAAARVRYAAGQASQGDVLRAQTERSRVEEQILALEAEREWVAAAFNAALGRTQSEAVDQALAPPPPVPPLPPEPELLSLARLRRPEVLEADAQVAAGRMREDLMRRDFYPDFRVAAQWNQIGTSANPMAPDPGQDAYMITVGVTLPVWRGKLRAGVREARAATAAAESRRQDRANEAEAQARAALATLRLQQNLLHLYASTLIPQAEASLQAAEVGYRSGGMDFLSVLDSERALLTLRLAESIALGEQGKAAAALARAVGQELDSLGASVRVASGRQP